MGKKSRPDGAAPSPTSNRTPTPGLPASNLEAFPEHARLLGLIVAEASNVEQLLVRLLAVTLRTEHDVIFPMLYSVASTRAKYDAMAAAFERLIPDEAQRADIVTAIAKATKLLGTRNGYAHGHYDFKGKTVYLVEMKHLGLRKAQRNLPLAELEQCFTDMKALAASVAVLIVRAQLQLPPEPPAPRA